MVLAQAYGEAGRLDEAETAMRKALEVGERVHGLLHPLSQHIRIGLADIVRQHGKLVEARSILAAVDQEALVRLGAEHPFIAELRRVEGLIALAEGRLDEAQRALGEALRIFELRYGACHTFTVRGRMEFAKVVSNAAGRGKSHGEEHL